MRAAPQLHFLTFAQKKFLPCTIPGAGTFFHQGFMRTKSAAILLKKLRLVEENQQKTKNSAWNF
jgi:hypothetical protein